MYIISQLMKNSMITLTEQFVVATYETQDFKTVEDEFTIFLVDGELEAIFDSSDYDVSDLELTEIVEVIQHHDREMLRSNVEHFIHNSLSL